jgi:hypothetical protein
MLKNNEIIEEYHPSGFSWGALGLTPIWLLVNGFWLSLVIYIISFIYFMPMAFIIGIVFFIKGKAWSWGNGNRWESVDKFEDSQGEWDIYGMIALMVSVIALVIKNIG